MWRCFAVASFFKRQQVGAPRLWRRGRVIEARSGGPVRSWLVLWSRHSAPGSFRIARGQLHLPHRRDAKFSDRSPDSCEAEHFADLPRYPFARGSTIAPFRSPARASRAPRQRQRRGALAARAACDPLVLENPLAPGRPLRRQRCTSARGQEGPRRRRK
jgi:hypothetical protein